MSHEKLLMYLNRDVILKKLKFLKFKMGKFLQIFVKPSKINSLLLMQAHAHLI